MNTSSESARVLVVEDDGIISKGIERRLQRMKYTVSGIAMCGSDAVRLAAELQPDVILMDIQLGEGIDGIDAAGEIHQFLDVPIIFLTAYSDDATIRRAKLVEPFGYVLKPYEDKDLQTSIEIGLYKHRMQKRLRDNEQWLAATLSSIGDGVIATDKNGKVRLINSLAEELTGWNQEDALGKHLVEVFEIVHETTREAVPNPVLEVLATGEPAVLDPDTILIDRNGKERPIDDSAAPILDSNGELSGAVLVFRDVSERRRLEELLRQTQKMESLGRLAGGIAHDFNNLLTIILGSCELLLTETDIAEEERGLVDSILDAGKRAVGLTQQIVAFSRKQVLEPRVLNLNDTVRDLSGMLRRLLGSNIDFVLRLEPELGMVRIDPAQLVQVILNLAVNARDAMPGGGRLELITTSTQLDSEVLAAHPEMKPGNYAMLQVADTGTGIPPEVIERIFEPFFTTKDVGAGTGLGLATAYGIVRQSGGYIEVTSAPGQGTTFQVSFPIVEKVSSSGEAVPATLLRGTETVLVVEDNTQVRVIARKVLENLGYTVIEAENGRVGIETSEAYAGHIDLLLTDLVMPEIGGRLAADNITEKRPATKVLFMSGYSDDVIIREGVESSTVKLLHKPFTLEQLASKVREVLDEE